jgi:hypothetical protein
MYNRKGVFDGFHKPNMRYFPACVSGPNFSKFLRFLSRFISRAFHSQPNCQNSHCRLTGLLRWTLPGSRSSFCARCRFCSRTRSLYACCASISHQTGAFGTKVDTHALIFSGTHSLESNSAMSSAYSNVYEFS